MKPLGYSKIEKRIHQLYNFYEIPNLKCESVPSKRLLNTLTGKITSLRSNDGFPTMKRTLDSSEKQNFLVVKNLVPRVEWNPVERLLQNLGNWTLQSFSSQVFYKKYILKRFLFFKRKLKFSNLLFTSKINKFSSIDAFLLKKNIQGFMLVCMDPLLDDLQKKIIHDSSLNKWMESGSNKVLFLLNNFWVHSYLYISFLVNIDQMKQRGQQGQRGKGFEINQFMIQFSLFRQFLFKIFYLMFPASSTFERKTEQMNSHWGSGGNPISFLCWKSFFQHVFFHCVYIWNDFEFHSRNQSFNFTDQIEKTCNLSELFKQKNEWTSISFEETQDFSLFKNFSLLWDLYLCSEIPKKSTFINSGVELYFTSSSICLGDSVASFPFETFQLLHDTFLNSISEGFLTQHLNMQLKTYLFAKKELFVLFVDFYKTTNPYQILNIERLYGFRFRTEIFYFHPISGFLKKYKNLLCMLYMNAGIYHFSTGRVFSPKKWESSWIYSLSRDFMIWQQLDIPTNFVMKKVSNPTQFFLKIVDSRWLFFKQKEILDSFFRPNKNALGSFFYGPSLWNVRLHLKTLKQIFQKLKASTQFELIRLLGQKIRLWSNYYKLMSPPFVFNYCDDILFQFLWKWSIRRHSNKSRQWIKNKYFHQIGNKKWVFATLLTHSKTRFLKENRLFDSSDLILKKGSTFILQLPMHSNKQQVTHRVVCPEGFKLLTFLNLND